MIEIECTICGKKVEKLHRAKIEGTVIDVCEECLAYGEEVLDTRITQPVSLKKKLRVSHLEEEKTVFVENYGELIAGSRKKKGLTREEFAKKIKEKESVIRRVEKEEMIPDDDLTKKIEKFLDIKLKKRYERKPIKKKRVEGELTLGDVVEVE